MKQIFLGIVLFPLLFLCSESSAAQTKTVQKAPINLGASQLWSGIPSSCNPCPRITVDPLLTLLNKYSNYDHPLNGTKDGEVEIHSLSSVDFGADVFVGSNDGLILIMIDDRLLNPPAGEAGFTSDTYLLPDLLRLRDDLRREGYRPRLIRTHLYKEGQHKDGEILLAIRAFFGELKEKFRNFHGALLIGDFPEALLVRSHFKHRYPHRREDGDPLPVIDGQTITGEWFQFLSEVIGYRADIVLADLDGNWEELYRKNNDNIPYIIGSIDTITYNSHRTNITVTSPHYSTTKGDHYPTHYNEFRKDFFHIQDSSYSVLPNNQIQITDFLDPEVALSDRQYNYPIASPEINVSTINPRHVALHPPEGHLGIDANGNPQSFERGINQTSGTEAPNPLFERKLLKEFFQRNHKHRTGVYYNRPTKASIATKGFEGKFTGFYVDRPDHTGFTESPDLFLETNLVGYTDFMKSTALIKAIVAHSNHTNSAFGSDFFDTDLEDALDNHIWEWSREEIGNNKVLYYPSVEKMTNGGAYWAYYKTVYENNLLPDAGHLYFHSGCNGISPPNWDSPYFYTGYSSRQNNESLLYLGNGLTLIGRSKIYFDSMFIQGVPILGAGGTMGKVWTDHFKYIRSHTKFGFDGTFKKKPYYWDIIGDWTLKLKYDLIDVPPYPNPDRFDTPSRNDSLPNKAVLPNLSSGLGPYIGELSFDQPNDIDFFQIQLPPATGPNGEKECRTTTSTPSGISTTALANALQGSFTLFFSPEQTHQAEINLYRPDGSILKTERGNFVSIKCPHTIYPQGKIIFSIRDLIGTTRYALYPSYRYSLRIQDIPSPTPQPPPPPSPKSAPLIIMGDKQDYPEDLLNKEIFLPTGPADEANSHWNMGVGYTYSMDNMDFETPTKNIRYETERGHGVEMQISHSFTNRWTLIASTALRQPGIKYSNCSNCVEEVESQVPIQSTIGVGPDKIGLSLQYNTQRFRFSLDPSMEREFLIQGLETNRTFAESNAFKIGFQFGFNLYRSRFFRWQLQGLGEYRFSSNANNLPIQGQFDPGAGMQFEFGQHNWLVLQAKFRTRNRATNEYSLKGSNIEFSVLTNPI